MSEEKKVRITVECDGHSETASGYTLLAHVVTAPRTSEHQKVETLRFGRLSPGDHLSAIVAAIAGAQEALKDTPEPIRASLLSLAIREGLKGGIKQW